MESSSSDDLSASENHSMYSCDSDLESMTELSLMSSSDISSESLGTDLQSDVENHSVDLDSCWSDDESVLELFPNDSDESESCMEDFEEPVVGLADNQDGTPLFSGGSITMLVVVANTAVCPEVRQCFKECSTKVSIACGAMSLLW